MAPSPSSRSRNSSSLCSIYCTRAGANIGRSCSARCWSQSRSMPKAASIRCWACPVAESLLFTRGLVKRFGGLVATDNLSIDVRAGEIHALIGPNGAGKTTLVSQLTGNLKPDSGRIHFAGRDVTHLPMHARVRLGLARSFQITAVLREFTTLDNVA